jgi:hypothetical protein
MKRKMKAKARAGIRPLLGWMVLLLLIFGLSTLAQYNTGWQDPSQDAGDFSAPFQAYHDGGGAAIAGDGEVHQYWGYSFNIPSGAQINGIEVRLDAWYSHCDVQTGRFYVELSWDGGVSWTSTGYNTGELACPHEATFILGGPSDTWGRTWTTSELSLENFRIRITAEGYNPEGEPFIHLDWAPVRVYYTPLNLSVDGSNLQSLTITQSDLDSWFGDPDRVQQPLGSFDVTITAGVNYRIDACYEVTPSPNPPFAGDPLKIENPQGSGNWDYLPQCPATIQLLGFSGTPGTETNTYPTEVDLSRLGDRKAGEPFHFTIRVRVSEL